LIAFLQIVLEGLDRRNGAQRNYWGGRLVALLSEVKEMGCTIL
jgi:hypothetical protein